MLIDDAIMELLSDDQRLTEEELKKAINDAIYRLVMGDKIRMDVAHRWYALPESHWRK